MAPAPTLPRPRRPPPGRRRTPGQRPHHRQRHLLITAAGEVLGVPRLAAGPGLGQIPLLAGPPRGLPQAVRFVAGGGQPRIQLRLLAVDRLTAGPGHGPHARRRARRLVVIEQVLVRQQSQIAQERLRKQPALLEAGQGIRVGQQAGEGIPAAALQPVQPAEMVQPVVAHAVEPSRRQRHPGRPGGTVHQGTGGITDADHLPAQNRNQRLGDHPGRIGEVDQPGVRAVRPHAGGQLHHGRDGPQRVGDAARAGGFLPQQPELLGHPFVGNPAGRSARADGGEHDVRPVEGPGGGTSWTSPRAAARRNVRRRNFRPARRSPPKTWTEAQPRWRPAGRRRRRTAPPR